jgi:hypothetical protein
MYAELQRVYVENMCALNYCIPLTLDDIFGKSTDFWDVLLCTG